MTHQPLQALPTVGIFHNAVRANADHGFIYLNNPKVGCSTIKTALWQALRPDAAPPDGDAVHVLAGSPFTADPQDAAMVERAFVFTFVRHPLQRLVSAYLNKVSGPGKREWHDFARIHGAGSGSGFDAFVDLLAAVPPELHDPHWRPQHLNTLNPFVKPNLLADLDHLDDLLPQIMTRLFAGQPVPMLSAAARSHNTEARATWRSHLSDPATLSRALTIYAGDFAAFGYRPDLGDAPPPPVVQSDHRHPGLARLITYRNAAGPDKAGALVALEQHDPAAALSDWILAQRLRHLITNRPKVLQMLHDNAPQIAAGPPFLQKIAEQVRTGPQEP